MIQHNPESLLPPADHYQYFSHIFHSQQFVPYEQYTPMQNWEYPELDIQRFKNIFLQDLSYIKDQRVLDLGCHTGYFSYIAKWLGAKSVHGVNGREFPLTVANYAYSQLGITDYSFDQHNIEDLNFLKSVCRDKDTAMMTLVLEHLRNPYAILETISNSDIQNLVIESSIIDDDNVTPLVRYYFQSTESAFTVYDDHNEREMAVGSCPNLAWLEKMLYWFGWRIELHKVERQFNRNWFASPGLEKFVPFTFKVATILCKKFDTTKNVNNYESSSNS
jgi:hypothetical protein